MADVGKALLKKTPLAYSSDYMILVMLSAFAIAIWIITVFDLLTFGSTAVWTVLKGFLKWQSPWESITIGLSYLAAKAFAFSYAWGALCGILWFTCSKLMKDLGGLAVICYVLMILAVLLNSIPGVNLFSPIGILCWGYFIVINNGPNIVKAKQMAGGAKPKTEGVTE